MAAKLSKKQLEIIEANNLKRRAMSKAEKTVLLRAMIKRMYTPAMKEQEDKVKAIAIRELKNSPIVDLAKKYIDDIEPFLCEQKGVDPLFTDKQNYQSIKSFTVTQEEREDRAYQSSLDLRDAFRASRLIESDTFYSLSTPFGIKGSFHTAKIQSFLDDMFGLTPPSIEIADLKIRSGAAMIFDFQKHGFYGGYRSTFSVCNEAVYDEIKEISEENAKLYEELVNTALTIFGMLNECKKAIDVYEVLPDALDLLPKEPPKPAQPAGQPGTALIASGEAQRINNLLQSGKAA